MAELNFRDATAGDIAALAELYSASVRTVAPARYSCEQVDAWARAPNDTDAFRAFVLDCSTLIGEDGTGIVGFCGIDDAGHVASLYVRGDRVRQGIGSRLLRGALARAEARGIAQFRGEASQFSLPVFLRCGFVACDVERVDYDGVEFERFIVTRGDTARAPKASSGTTRGMERVLAFLRCRTPDAWLDAAAADVPTLLLDHAALELKAAEQAQAIIRRYAMPRPVPAIAASLRAELTRTLSRLAREELRHFEQVLDMLAARGLDFTPVSASRYAAGLRAECAASEPERLVDTLIVGAIIEARSCERFAALAPRLAAIDAGLARFYAALLRSEARHFEDYLGLAERAAGAAIDRRVDRLLDADAALVTMPDECLRFHSGVPE